MRRFLRILFCLGLPLAGFAQTVKPRTQRIRHPNVLLITIDTVRADHTGVYGSTSVETPTLNSLASDSVVFDRAISQVPLTFPSHASLLTGMYPFATGAQDFTSPPLPAGFRTLSQSFRAAGYTTGAVVSSFVLDRSWGLSRGFETYDDHFDPREFTTQDLALVERKAGPSVELALKWLRQAGTKPKPFFFWLHLYDPHKPYDPPEPFASEYKGDLYSGEIAYADHELGRVIALLKSKRLYANTVIAVLSDHGESLGDHGEKEHGFFLYDSTIRVPLIIKPAAISQVTPERVSGPVEIMSTGPTLLALAHIHDSIQKQFQAPSLVINHRVVKVDAAYSETFYPFSSFGWHPLRAIHAAQYEYIEAPQPELYAVERDPEQRQNLAETQPAVSASLKLRLNEIAAKNQPRNVQTASRQIDPTAAEKLRQLGYMALRSPVKIEALDSLADPKEKIGELEQILSAQDAFHSGQFERGQQLLAPVEQQDRGMYLIPFVLAEADMRQGKWSEAEQQFRKSLELNPGFEQAMTGLSSALQREGNLDEARKWLERALEQAPHSFRLHYQLGTVLASGDPERASAEFERSIELQPQFAFAYRELGFMRSHEKKYAAATNNLHKAVALGLREPKLLNELGICQSQLGEFKSAIASYKSALQLDPNLAEAHLNLGLAYQRTGNADLSRQEYQDACSMNARLCNYVPR